MYSLSGFIIIVSKTVEAKTTASMLIMILLQAVVAIQISMLIRSGDVETNPGPGRYGGE